MALRTNHIVLPSTGSKLKTLTRTSIGSGINGCGGSFLLDGGLGGQSSYASVDDYYDTIKKPNKGYGLSDKIGSKLQKLNINPKRKTKNITFDF